VRERDVNSDHGLLKYAELGSYKQLGPAGNTEKRSQPGRGPQSPASIPRRGASSTLSGSRASLNSLPISFANPQPFRRQLPDRSCERRRKQEHYVHRDGEHYKPIDAGSHRQVAHHHEDAETKDKSRDRRRSCPRTDAASRRWGWLRSADIQENGPGYHFIEHDWIPSTDAIGLWH
jgi:hypothetical protein